MKKSLIVLACVLMVGLMTFLQPKVASSQGAPLLEVQICYAGANEGFCDTIYVVDPTIPGDVNEAVQAVLGEILRNDAVVEDVVEPGRRIIRKLRRHIRIHPVFEKGKL